MIRKIARLSRISLAVIALVGLVALTLFGLFGEKVLRTQVESRLSEALGRTVTVGALSVNLPGRVVELRDVLIPGHAGSRRPTLMAPRMRIALSFRSLFTSKILLRGFELDRPRISVQVFPDGTTDLPQTAPSAGPSSRQISIGKLVITSGDLFLNDQQIPLDIVWPHLEANLVADAMNLLKGDISAGPGPMRFGDLPAQEARVDLGIRLADSILHIDRGSFTTPGTALAIEGQVDLHDDPKGELRFTGPFDLESFDQKIAGAGLDLKGIANTNATLTIDGGKIALNGTLRGERGSYGALSIDAFSTRLFWDGSNVQLKDLALDVLSGKALLDVNALADSPVKVKGQLTALAAEPLLHWLFDYGTAGLGARVSGPVDLSFPKGAANLLSGTGQLSFVGDPSLGEPLSGVFPFKAERGVITMTGVELQAPKTAVTLAGTIQPDKRLSVDVRLVSEDLAATDALSTRLRAAFGTLNPQPLGALGRGVFEGRAVGTMSAPVVSGRFIGTDVSYLGVAWGALDWTGTASTVDLKSDRLIAVRGTSRIEASGMQRLGATGVDDALDLNVTIRDWSAKDLLKIVASDLDVDTTVSGSMRLLGTRALPLGSATLTSAAGKAMGVAYTQADLELRFEGEALRVQSLKATLGGGRLSVQGVLADEAGLPAFEGAADFAEIELADLGMQEESDAMIGGHITGRATFSGPLERPRVSAHVESKRIFYGDEGMGALILDVVGKGDGNLQVTASSDSPRFRAAVTGSIGAKAPYPSHLEVKLTNARIDPVLRALGSRFENAVVITASANARVEGPLQDPESITAQLRDGKLRVALPDYAIEAAPGSIIDVEKGEVRIAGLTLQGDGTSLSVSGKWALKPDDRNDLAITGRADLRVLSGFLREWRFRGAATLRSQIGGTPNAIQVSGGLDIEDGSVRLRGFPQGLDDLNGRLVFNETQARVAGLEGRFGGGRVSVSGLMGFGGATPASFDFLLNGTSLGLRYPEGLRSTFGAALRLQGTTQSHWLTGDLMVSKALWNRKYTITSELLGSSNEASSFARAGSASFKPSPMHLDIGIKAPGTLRLDNNLASLVASADLALTGSPLDPQLLGRVEVERGKVFFRGNTYEVRKGVAHFSNPRQINPVFDIEADTRVRAYRLTLQANGTLDRVSSRITSDPPLTSPQIASLLTGGDVNDVANVAGSSTDFKALGTGGANSVASSVLEDAVTGRVAQGVGLSRLSIDPGKGFLSRTGMRLTVGKRVTQDIEVVYSQVFGGVDSKLVTAEYSLTNRFSLVASWEQPGGFGLDLRTRFVLDR